MATSSNDQELRDRLQDEPSVKPSDTRTVLQDDRQETQQVRYRVRGLEGVAPEDTLDELREAGSETPRARAEREERAEEERRREARRQAEAAQQAEQQRKFSRELDELLSAAAPGGNEQEVATGFEQREALLDRLEGEGGAAVVTREAARQWVARDVQDLDKLQDARRSVALDRLVENVQRVPSYREALERHAPEVLKAADERAAANVQRAAEKDALKEAEAEAMLREKAERAQKWPPDVAAQQAGADVAHYREQTDGTERYHIGRDMALNARHSQAYRDTLQRTAPDLAKVVESYRTDAPAVDLRRLERLTAAAGAQAAEARAWAAEEASKRASADAQALHSAKNVDERFKALYDISLGSRQNRHYREAMQEVDPRTFKEAKELEKETILVSSTELRALRDSGQPATAHPRYIEALERRHGSEVAANDPQPPRGDASNDPRRGPQMTLEAADLQRVADSRARDKEEAERALGVQPAPAPPAASKAEEQAAQASVDRGLQAQLDEEQRRRERREQEQAGANTVDVNRTGKELERGEFIMPRRLTQAYTEVDGKFFAKDSNRVMFEDRGNKLATSTTEKAAVADMVALAKAKQWESLKLTGSQEFRREAWLQAESQGMRTQGYTPKQADLAALESLRQERATNSITPLQERKPAERERQVDQPLTRAPRHDLNKNQAAIHDAATKALTSNLAELHKRPELRERSEEDMQKLAFWRGVVAETNKLQPEAVQKEALARFDQQAENPQFVSRLNQATEPKVQDKTSERMQVRETREQTL